MIERYSRPRMSEVWSQQNRFEKMLQVEKALAVTQAEEGLIPMAAASAIQKKGSFKLERITQIEAETRHDVIAFVSAVAEEVGPYGRFVHFGVTSSDILDTGLNLIISEAFEEIQKSIDKLDRAILKKIQKHRSTLCAGRTHGMHAEPTTFGLKLYGFLMELRRNRDRLERAVEQVKVCKLSGAVGTYSAMSPQIEKGVARRLRLRCEDVATQVVPRDRHCEVIVALALLGSGLERLSVELRHLQRTEVSEVCEGFSKGQKGSSAMPHKKNPISSENITGASRLLRSYSHAAMENIALWHERDISHSSVERVIFPDAFILSDYIVDRMAGVMEGLQVDVERMWENMEFSHGQLFSSHVLLALVQKGVSREAAYVMVQRSSHSLKKGESLKGALSEDQEVRKLLSQKELDEIFSGKRHLESIEKLIKGLFKKEKLG